MNRAILVLVMIASLASAWPTDYTPLDYKDAIAWLGRRATMGIICKDDHRTCWPAMSRFALDLSRLSDTERIDFCYVALNVMPSSSNWGPAVTTERGGPIKCEYATGQYHSYSE